MNSEKELTVLLYKCSLQKFSNRFPDDIYFYERNQKSIDTKRRAEGGYIGEKRRGRFDTGEKAINNKFELYVNWETVFEEKNLGIGKGVHIYKQVKYSGHRGQPKYVLVVPIVQQKDAVHIGDKTIIDDNGIALQLSKQSYKKILQLMNCLWKYTHGWNNTRIENVSTYNVSNFGEDQNNINPNDYEQLTPDMIFKLFELEQRILYLEELRKEAA